MIKYLNRLTELHCEQRHHKFIDHNICKLINFSSNFLIENPKSKRKRKYRQNIKCSVCNKEMYSDNFPKHNKTAHQGKGKVINIVDTSQKRLSFTTCHVLNDLP